MSIDTKQFVKPENMGKDLPTLINVLAIVESSKKFNVLTQELGEIYYYAE